VEIQHPLPPQKRGSPLILSRQAKVHYRDRKTHAQKHSLQRSESIPRQLQRLDINVAKLLRRNFPCPSVSLSYLESAVQCTYNVCTQRFHFPLGEEERKEKRTRRESLRFNDFPSFRETLRVCILGRMHSARDETF